MQICLQTKAVKKIIFCAVTLVVCVGAAVLSVKTQNLSNHENATVNAQKSKYLATGNNNSQNPVLSPQNINEPEFSKMNNESAKNSSVVDFKGGINKISTVRRDAEITVYNHKSNTNEQMLLEDYIIGCVCAEMPASFDLQALMAQAVAVRTFSVRKMLYDNSDSHKNAHVCTDYRHCQSYLSKEEYMALGQTATEQYEKIKQAVYGTNGVIAMYDGEPIMAVYHASSGVATKDCADVWGGEIPYLVSVPAPEDKSVCAKEYEFSYKQLSNKLSEASDVAVQCFSPSQVTVSSTANSKSLSISNVNFEPSQIKKSLNLRSEYFDVALNEDKVVFKTYGYGHLVGMSQYGADALAKQGKSYIDILKYYYKGIELGCLN